MASFSEKVLESKLITQYRDEMREHLKRMYPDISRDKLDKVINKQIAERFQNPEVIMDNNYTGDSKKATLLGVTEWAANANPIISGNGTFYRNQYEAMNPIAQMLLQFLGNRKKYKKELFKIEDTASFQYLQGDLKQQNEKKKTNSYYGASGAKSSMFYSKWSGPATTGAARQVISTTEQFFEHFLVDNYDFVNMSEELHWIKKALEQRVDDIDDFVTRKSVDDVFERLQGRTIQEKDSDDRILRDYLSSFDEDELTIIYYKSNLMAFIKENIVIQDLIKQIFVNIENLDYVDDKDTDWKSSIPEEYREEYENGRVGAKRWNKDVNTRYFMDPNDAPDTIKPSLEKLNDYVRDYVYCDYMSFDRVYRLSNLKRNVVTVIDTDSNILSLDTLVNYIFDEVVDIDGNGRDREHNEFICVNILAYIITSGVTDILLSYGRHSNIPEEFRPLYNMKNEFFFSLLVIALTKKRYLSNIKLREGNLMNPAKHDIKGFDFKKSTCSEEAEKRFMDILQERIFSPEEIDVKGMIMDIRDFKSEIIESIKGGDKRFLPNASAKELSAYSDPSTQASVRGVAAWDALNPDNQVEVPAKVSMLKLTTITENDIEPLKETEPEIYQTIMDKIFNDTTGLFVKKTWESEFVDYVNPNLHIELQEDWVSAIPKKYRAKYKTKTPKAWNKFVDEYIKKHPENNTESGKWIIKSAGMQVLAIPNNGDIPEWVKPYIDYSTLSNNIIAPFASVFEIFKNIRFTEGTSRSGVDRKTPAPTNIIRF